MLLVLGEAFVGGSGVGFSAFVLNALGFDSFAHDIGGGGEGGCLAVVLVEDDVVVVLGHVGLESVVFGHEADQLGAGAVVGQLGRHLALVLKHGLEQRLPVTPSLHLVVHIEVKHTEWLHFNDLSAFVPNKQVFLPYFDKSDALFVFSFEEKRVVVR